MAGATILEIQKAISDTNGNLSAAARVLEISRSVLQAKVDANPDLITYLDDVRQTNIDEAEQNVFRDVSRGDPNASRFILSTLGRDRGYIQGVGGMGKDGALEVVIREFSKPEAKDG